MSSLLAKLRQLSVVVADTGDLEAIRRFAPQDATTNPSLILKAVESGQYDQLLNQIIENAASQSADQSELLSQIADRLIVAMGAEILKEIPGRISTEVDARLSFDTEATLAKARELITLYEALGVSREKVLIKIAGTWEGIKAAEQLKSEGIECNVTLIFSFAQARACAEAAVFLISPFVGRVLDWYKAKEPNRDFQPNEEPGVLQVREIYQYFRKHQFPTIVMGASFRNVGEILALAGCDRLTISPALLEALQTHNEPLSAQLSDNGDRAIREAPITAAEFHWQMNADPMSIEKLSEGIRGFAADQEKLDRLLIERLSLTQSRAQ